MTKKLLIPLILILGLLFFHAQCTPRERVNFRELAQKPNTVIIDVRTPAEFAEGHIGQSVNIPLQVLPDFIEDLEEFDNIILICRSGNRSGYAQNFLRENGLQNSYNGGGWERFQRRYLR